MLQQADSTDLMLNDMVATRSNSRVRAPHPHAFTAAMPTLLLQLWHQLRLCGQLMQANRTGTTDCACKGNNQDSSCALQRLFILYYL
jgi:hypothetical protein